MFTVQYNATKVEFDEGSGEPPEGFLYEFEEAELVVMNRQPKQWFVVTKDDNILLTEVFGMFNRLVPYPLSRAMGNYIIQNYEESTRYEVRDAFDTAYVQGFRPPFNVFHRYSFVLSPIFYQLPDPEPDSPDMDDQDIGLCPDCGSLYLQ